MYRRITTITPPTAQPVTLEDAKLFARIDAPDDDTLLLSLIMAAAEHVETILGRRLMVGVYELHLSEFPLGRIVLPFSPVSSVTGITYADDDGTIQPFTAWDAYLDDDAPFIAPTRRWPFAPCHPDAVLVQFVAGYQSPPERARLAILSLVAHWYEHREPNSGNAREVPHHITRLLNSTRTWAQV